MDWFVSETESIVNGRSELFWNVSDPVTACPTLVILVLGIMGRPPAPTLPARTTALSSIGGPISAGGSLAAGLVCSGTVLGSPGSELVGAGAGFVCGGGMVSSGGCGPGAGPVVSGARGVVPFGDAELWRVELSVADDTGGSAVVCAEGRASVMLQALTAKATIMKVAAEAMVRFRISLFPCFELKADIWGVFKYDDGSRGAGPTVR